MSCEMLRLLPGGLLFLAIVACSGSDPEPGNDGSSPGGGTDQGGSSGNASGAVPGKAGTASGGTASGGTPGGAGTPGSAGEAQGGQSSTELRGPCQIAERVGRFSIEKQKDFGVVQGTVSEGVVPTAIPKLVLEKAGCRVLERRNLSCVPACEGTQTCGEDGKCIPFPRQLSVGEVTISGLTKAVKMSPQKPGAVYFAPGQDNPPFSAAAQIALAASGAEETAAFELFGVGSEPLETAPTWELARDQDLMLTWPSPSTPGATDIVAELTIDQHGLSPLSVNCRFDDTGAAVVPKEIVTYLIDSGVSGFPNGRMQRQTADHVALDVGCVELTVGSAVTATVRVAGFTSCTKAGDCPEGKTCNTMREICE